MRNAAAALQGTAATSCYHTLSPDQRPRLPEAPTTTSLYAATSQAAHAPPRASPLLQHTACRVSRVSPSHPAVKTHRELFSDFFTSLFGYDLQQLIADSPAPHHAKALFDQMMRDISSGGTALTSPLEQVGARSRRQGREGWVLRTV